MIAIMLTGSARLPRRPDAPTSAWRSSTTSCPTSTCCSACSAAGSAAREHAARDRDAARRGDADAARGRAARGRRAASRADSCSPSSTSCRTCATAWSRRPSSTRPKRPPRPTALERAVEALRRRVAAPRRPRSRRRARPLPPAARAAALRAAIVRARSSCSTHLPDDERGAGARRARRASRCAGDARRRAAEAVAARGDIEGLTMLTSFDDYPVHQTAEPVAQPAHRRSQLLRPLLLQRLQPRGRSLLRRRARPVPEPPSDGRGLQRRPRRPAARRARLAPGAGRSARDPRRSALRRGARAAARAASCA